jgi:Dyp-type peroxidase family
VESAVIELGDLQGGIVRGYGSTYPVARHLFAQVRDPGAARRFLADLWDPVTTAEEWQRGSFPQTTLNVALSFRALQALGVPEALLGGFPEEFCAGMGARAEQLGDDPGAFDDELRELEVLLVVHGQDADVLDAEAQRWEGELAGGGLELSHAEPGGLLGGAREHFGFTDGFSQPAIEGAARQDIPGQGIAYKRHPWWPLSRMRWRAIKPGEFVLGYEDEDRGPAPAPPPPFHRNASFMVWRKLHQDVATFRAQLAEQAATLGLDEELLAAKLVGRWRDGSPLALRPDAPDPVLGNDKDRANDFRYGNDAKGLRTPRGAHVRRANPRDALGWEARLSARHRILRRGMPYGSPLPDGEPDDGAARGLLFVCLQASIARQFEIVQERWCNDGNAFGLGAEGDPIAGGPARPTRHIIEGDPPRFASLMRSCVECRGGEYLFVPSIAALRALPAL